MKTPYHKALFVLVCASLFSITASVAAQPHISVLDTPHYDAGTFREQQMPENITHTFTIQNTGDADLHIHDVHAGCGCTVVKYDDVIAPGKTGTITQSITSNSLRNGHFKKSITVRSDAANNNALSMSIRGNVMKLIAYSPYYLRLNTGDDNRVEVELKTHKTDFTVTEVRFKPRHKENEKSWKQSLSIPLDHSIVQKDSTDTNGYHIYTLTLSAPSPLDTREYGSFIVYTNHPEKKKLSIRGTMY